MFYSVDGKKWTLLTGISNMNRIEYHDGVYISKSAGNRQTFRSTDGINWTAIDILDGGTSCLCFHKGKWFAGKSGGTYCSADGGVTWQQIADTKMREMVSSGEVAIGVLDGYNADNIRRSTDGGVTWESCGITASLGTVHYLHGIWYVKSSSATYMSLDNGKSWIQLTLPEGYTSINKIHSDGVTLLVEARDKNYNNQWFYAPMFEQHQDNYLPQS